MAAPTVLLGHRVVGAGPTNVVVLNDWMADTTTWASAEPYLDGARFTWLFADLRGYGRSRGLRGAFTLLEAAADVLALADAQGWAQLVIVGHSMSSLIALHLGQHYASRISHAVAITPPPPRGFGADEAALDGARALAMAGDARRAELLQKRFGTRLSAGWGAYKAAQWGATSEREAAATYVALFARDGLAEPSRRITVPVLAVTGEQDMEPMRRAAVTASLAPICPRLTVVALAESGHHPMQETPPLLVAHIERFLRDETS